MVVVLVDPLHRFVNNTFFAQLVHSCVAILSVDHFVLSTLEQDARQGHVLSAGQFCRSDTSLNNVAKKLLTLSIITIKYKVRAHPKSGGNLEQPGDGRLCGPRAKVQKGH